MNPQLDIGKLVGAASAPVALIIATSIFLGNLGGKYAMLGGVFRDLSSEYRNAEHRQGLRARSLEDQMRLYSWRLRTLMRATLVLTLSIESFVLTVVFTCIGVIFPGKSLWFWATAFCSFAGLLLLAVAVVMELLENQQARHALMLETAEFKDVLADPDQEDDKRGFAASKGEA